MASYEAPQSRRVEILTLAVCVLLSLLLLSLPSREKIRVADALGTVLTTPYERVRDFIADVGRVRARNDRLQAELTALKTDRDAAGRLRRERDELRRALGLLDAAPSVLVPCEVQRRRVATAASLVQVRAAEAVAWERYQAVITPDGLVGRVYTATGPNTAWVELLNSPGMAVSCMLSRTGLPGILHPTSGDEFELTLVGRDEDVRVGDRVVTSDIGVVQGADGEPLAGLPRGLPVGEVVGVESPPEKLFKVIRVQPRASFSRLDVVFVVVGRGDELSANAFGNGGAP